MKCIFLRKPVLKLSRQTILLPCFNNTSQRLEPIKHAPRLRGFWCLLWLFRYCSSFFLNFHLCGIRISYHWLKKVSHNFLPSQDVIVKFWYYCQFCINFSCYWIANSSSKRWYICKLAMPQSGNIDFYTAVLCFLNLRIGLVIHFLIFKSHKMRSYKYHCF